MSDRTRILTGRIVSGVAVTAATLGCLWMVLLGRPDALWRDYLAQNAIVAVGFGAMVWMVVPSQPRNRVVWISALAAVSTGLTVLATATMYAALAERSSTGPIWEAIPAELPLPLALVGMVLNSLWVSILLVPTLVVLHLPNGELPTQAWRWVSRACWVLWAVGVLGFLLAARPSATASFGEIQRVELSLPITTLMSSLGFLGMGLLIPVCVAGIVVRYRKSYGEERQQLRWVAWGASIAGPVLVVAIWVETAGNVDLALSLLAVSLLVLVASFAVSIGKYRLYDVDVFINRTVVFGVLVGFVALIYAALVLGLGALIGRGNQGWTPILATAVVALAFEPVRQVAQKWANRLAYGHRATPYEVLADVTERLTGAGEGGDILERLADLVVDGTGADRAIVWLGAPGEMRPVVSTADELPGAELDLDSPSVFPVTVDGDLVGAIEVVKPRGMSLSTQEKRLMADLVGSAGAVFAYRRLNESLALKAEEIEASRSRLVEAEDAERRRLEHELNEGAQQAILALKVNVGLARRQAADQASEGLVGLLEALEDETQAALDEVRNLAKGIYPPVLESDGLRAAVSALAAGYPVEVQVVGVGVGRYSREIEAAVYFDISEALTNAVKHAEPPVRIELSQENGLLRFSVSDSGPGFDPESVSRGSGLQNLYDRVDAVGGSLSLTSAPGSATSVVGEIPAGARSVVV